jgi:excisionase family DNA binding protein
MTIDEMKAWTATVSPQEAAERLGLQVSTLANWRWCGRGPRFLRVGRRVRYRLADLTAWMELQARPPIPNPTPAPSGGDEVAQRPSVSRKQ